MSVEDYNMSNQEIADALGISIDKVAYTQKQAFVKMRKYCENHNIKFDDFVESLSK